MKLMVTKHPECISYLKLNYEGSSYTLEEFYSKYYLETDRFNIDRLFERTTIQYKSIKLSFAELVSREKDFSKKLEISNLYYNILYPKMREIFFTDKDYYASINLIKAMEAHLEMARLALLESAQILDMNINISWQSGYGPIYKKRTIRANNAILCYNNVFDYLMQIIYIAFEIYKHHECYKKDDNFEAILKRCDYNFLSDFYGHNKVVTNFKELWDIISAAQKININVNKWANYLKHKGGITYTGLELQKPFYMKIILDGEKDVTCDDFENLEVDLEEVIEELEKVHLGYNETISKLINFMGFDKIVFENIDGYIPILSKSDFKKVIFEEDDYKGNI